MRVNIFGWHKDKQSLAQYITAEKVDDDKGDNATSNQKSSMLDKLHLFTPWQCPSMFSVIGKDKSSKPSMFHKLKGDKHSKPFILPKSIQRRSHQEHHLRKARNQCSITWVK